MALSDLLASFRGFTKRSTIAQYQADLQQILASLNEVYREQQRHEQAVATDGAEVSARAIRQAEISELVRALEHRKRTLLGEIDHLERAAKSKADEALAGSAAAEFDRSLLALEEADQQRNRAAMGLIALLQRLADPGVRALLQTDPTANRRSTILLLIGEQLPPGLRSLFADGHSLSLPEAQRRAAERSQVGPSVPRSRLVSEVKI